MEKDYIKEHEDLRKKMWINAWCQVAGAIGCNETKTADKWADEALKSFDLRFPKQSINEGK